jgi:tetratricopeptide (TPR) repeat protein
MAETIEEVLVQLQQQPHKAELHQQLGMLYAAAKRTQEAQDAYERALELDPNDAFTHLYLSNLFYTKEDYQAALSCCQTAAKIIPDTAIVHWMQGDIYRALGNFVLAQNAFETASRVAPDDEKAHQRLLEWYEGVYGTSARTKSLIHTADRNNQAATVILLAKRWLQTNPDDFSILLTYAENLYMMTRYEEAIRIYKEALARFPAEGERWVICNQLGRMYQYWGRPAEAEPWFRQAIDEDPEEIGAYVFLGACQARQGKLKEAEATHRAATINCTNSFLLDEAYCNLGLVLRGQGRFVEAAECLRKAIELTPKYEDALDALRDVEAVIVLTAEDELSPEFIRPA